MTGKELLETVAQMGFAQTLEHNESYFWRAANLSLSRICRSFPLLGRVSVCPKRGEEYDLAARSEDFLGFPASPIFGEACATGAMGLYEGRDYLIRGSRVLFLHEQPKGVTVLYIRRPRTLTEDNAHEPLDIHPMAESLLPLLVSSYLWLDDRGELATHYLSLYRTEAEELRRQMYRHGTVEIHTTNGWDKS